jgi:hypothetical protein
VTFANCILQSQSRIYIKICKEALGLSQANTQQILLCWIHARVKDSTKVRLGLTNVQQIHGF